MRFFRTSPAIYSAIRAALDGIWNHPKTAIHWSTYTPVETISCLPDLSEAIQKEGMVYVALGESMIQWEAVQQQISSLISGGQIEEVDEQTFRQAMPPPATFP